MMRSTQPSGREVLVPGAPWPSMVHRRETQRASCGVGSREVSRSPTGGAAIAEKVLRTRGCPWGLAVTGPKLDRASQGRDEHRSRRGRAGRRSRERRWTTRGRPRGRRCMAVALVVALGSLGVACPSHQRGSAESDLGARLELTTRRRPHRRLRPAGPTGRCPALRARACALADRRGWPRDRAPPRPAVRQHPTGGGRRRPPPPVRRGFGDLGRGVCQVALSP